MNVLGKVARAGASYQWASNHTLGLLIVSTRQLATASATNELEPSQSSRLASTPDNKSDDDGPVVKSFKQIEQEMRKRSIAKNNVPFSVQRELKSVLKARRTTPQLMDPRALTDKINIGDLLLVNLNPVIVVKLPQQPEGKIVVASADGSTSEINVRFVDARLGSLVPSSIKFVGPDGHVGPAIHAVLAAALRRIYVVASELSVTYLEAVRESLLKIGNSSNSKATTLPFMEFVKDVTHKRTPAEVDFYAVRLCLEHYTLVNRWLLDFQYSGRYALTIVPTEMERCHLKMITLPDVTRAPEPAKRAFLEDYALHNLPGAEAESCALEILRAMPDAKSCTSLDSDEAAAVVFKGATKWPGLARMRYDWFTKADRPLSTVSATADAMASVRKEFSSTPVYCIDPEDVREVDDGISWEQGPNGKGTLGIHIADPTSFLSHEELVELVSKTPATAHFEDTYFPFLPKSITDRMQLAPGRPCVSVMVEIDLDQSKIGKPYLAAHQLGNNVIAKPYNVVDKELESSGENVWKVIQKVTKLLKQSRKGFDLASSPLSPAAAMVAECMVFAGKSVAQMCSGTGVPIPFRSQEVQFWNRNSQQEFESLAKTGNIGFRWSQAIRKSLVSTSPDGGHYGLGVDAYTLFTSPLRRGEDVLVHMQVLQALLLGQDPKLSTDDIAQLIPWIQLGTELIKESQRGSQRFSKLSTIKKSDIPQKGIVADLDDRTGCVSKVWLPDHGVMGSVDKADIDLALDEIAWFKIKHANAVGGSLILEIV